MLSFADLEIGDCFRFNVHNSPICTKLTDDIWGKFNGENRIVTAERIMLPERPLNIKVLYNRKVNACDVIGAKTIAISGVLPL